jgi:hypothetical protein
MKGPRMNRKMAARSNKISGNKNRPAPRDSFRFVKAVVLLVAAALSLAAGIYKGGEGLFFGIVFAMGCGLLGGLFLIRDRATTKPRRK